MRADWVAKSFEDCLERIDYPAKVQRKYFRATGKFPVISQESDFINGYWDGEDDVLRVDRPPVVFGDHTQVLKYVDFDFVLGADGVKLLKPKPFIDPKFFYYFLMAYPVKGVGYARHYRFLKELTVTYPPLREQQRIGVILDEAFAGLATATANVKKNLKNARELFDSYLDSIFANALSEWPNAKLGETSEQVTDGTHNSPPYVLSGIPMLDSKHINDDFTIDDSNPEKFISRKTDDLLAQRCKPRQGDILVSSRGSIGKIAIVSNGQDFNIMGNIILIRLPSSIDRKFAAFYLHSQVSHIESIARGVAQKGLYLGQVRDYRIPLPPLSKQAEIGQTVNLVSEETKRVEAICRRKLEAVAELKQSILQKAFSGEVTSPPSQAIKEAAE